MGALALIAWATLTPEAPDPAHRVPSSWCLACGGLWLTDALSNIALFLPFGVALALYDMRWTRVLAWATLLSVVVETCQYLGLPPGRSAAVADVLTNALGAVIGALLATHWFALLRPRRRTAAWMALGWSIASALVMLLTAVAVGSPRRFRAERTTSAVDGSGGAAPLFAPSVRTHPPSFGWYGGQVDSARLVSSSDAPLRIRRGWGGPIMVQARQSFDSLHATVSVRGRDANTAFVPLLYIHLGADSTPAFMIGQHDGDAELRLTRRAWELGLRLPALRLPNAFAARPVADSSTLTLIATVTAGTLSLSAQTTSSTTRASREVTRHLDVTGGWALLQSVVAVDSVLAPLALFCWLVALVAPVGWWAARTLQRSRASGPDRASGAVSMIVAGAQACALATPMLLATIIAPRLTGVSAIPSGIALAMLALFVLPFAFVERGVPNVQTDLPQGL